MSSRTPLAIGVFDSGLGGLSVLKELRAALPNADFIYVSDAGHCPYGGKRAAEITDRAEAITDFLLAQGARLMVVACNTATIAAIESLRAGYAVSFVGMEPAVKPAVALTKSGVVGVLATGAALAGEKFHKLVADHGAGVRMITQPCPGWVEQVEAGDLDSPRTRELVAQYTQPLLAEGADVLVLGCTHYPFLRPRIAELAGPAVTLLESGEAVARQTRRVLERENLLAAREVGSLQWLTSGDPALTGPVIERLLTVTAS